MRHLTIDLQPSYSLDIGIDLLASEYLLDVIRCQATKIVVISDHIVAPLYAIPLLNRLLAAHIDAIPIIITAGEASKTRETKQAIEDQLFDQGIGRDACLIAVGGGMITDLVGFVAATYYRGIPVIYIPTTLLAMVDAAIGGKTGVNTTQGKNMIGCFSQPRHVVMDVQTLQSLSDDGFADGLVETLKHALLLDANFFHQIMTHIQQIRQSDLIELVYKSCDLKRQVVEQDEFEQTGFRHILNFGHTIGHAIECAVNYQVSHGYAVLLGMLAESYLSQRLGLLNQIAFDKIVMSLQQIRYSQSITFDRGIINAVKQNLIWDKKAIGENPRFILLADIGIVSKEDNCYLWTVSFELIGEALQWLAKQVN